MKSKIFRGLLHFSFTIYVLALIYILFGGTRAVFNNMSLIEYAKVQMNLIPFKTITEFITALMENRINTNIVVENILGNLLMFLPMGIYLPIYLKNKISIKKFIIIMLILFIGVELVQLLTKRGAFDVDDLILNLAGSIIGYGIYRIKFVQKIIEEYLFPTTIKS